MPRAVRYPDSDRCCPLTRCNRGPQPPAHSRRQGSNRAGPGIAWAVSEVGAVVGDEPLVDGMNISVRIRTVTVTDADRRLAEARHMYRELHQGTSADTAAVMVTCAADALYMVLEHAACSATWATADLPATSPTGWQSPGGEPKPSSTSRIRRGRDGTVCGPKTCSHSRPAPTSHDSHLSAPPRHVEFAGRGADPDTPSASYRTVFHRDRACLRLLLEHGARAEGPAALGAAISGADTEAVRILLDADVGASAPIPADALGGAHEHATPVVHTAGRRRSGRSHDSAADPRS
jgi:hypothetical protein